eukprot:COSAG02_NODE_1100_length_14582_cov_130.690672_9_plen_231_part_00
MAKGGKKGGKKGKAVEAKPEPEPEPEPKSEPEPEPEPELEPEPEPEPERKVVTAAASSAADRVAVEQAEDAAPATSQRASRVGDSGVEERASDAYESMTPQQLKEECRRAGLSPDGLKEELVRRLREATQAAASAEEKADVDKPMETQSGGQNDEGKTARGEMTAEEGDPPETEEGAERPVPAEIHLDATVPESEVALGALKADFIRDLAERLGVDPSRIKITAVEEAEA